MSLPRRSLLRAGGAVLAAPAIARAALPQGVVRVLVGFPPGGGTDVMGRVIAEALRRRGALRNVVIENRAGASGTVACEALKYAPPDGTTLLFAPSASTVQPVLTFRRLPFDPRTDFAPVTLTGTVQTCWVLSPNLPFGRFEEYVAWVKADARRGSFGSTALGSSTHFFGLQLGGAFGLALEPVGYRGAAPVIADLSAGHIAAGCGGVSDFLTFHRDGKLRIVLTSGPRRGATTPDIPTIAELGHPDQASFGFYAFYAPAGTPAPMVAALRDELAAATMEAEAKAQLLAIGLEPEVSTPAELGRILAEDIERWRPVVEKSGFRVD
ncbi:tripartite tricarboxylate transporter substrate-binding protein [Roseicella frigidaeris]|uniref:Twin-arginine translocation pathway signal n=1 Tax=Roseicella frigidaeris TaxID=2230885 RepID=A0A327M138_9PROT|nr:tripartite tricarboxylate transporter substrate-binding protein [Roseicella frigidaeris]RAI55995.1 Twin-arginine translocation pathway signal [Roseicella frigidaeris]